MDASQRQNSGTFPLSAAGFNLSNSVSADPLLSNNLSGSGSSLNENVPDNLRYIQQLYQEKQANLLLHFQQAQADLAMQHFRYMQHAAQQVAAAPVVTSPTEVRMVIPTGSVGHIPSGSQTDLTKLKRSYSGSGSTISDQTREKLKNTILNKQNRRKVSSGIIASSPHFEPYPVQLGTHNPTEFELRKVSSEPNLKMRSLLRAKLLNRTQRSPPNKGTLSAFQTLPLREHRQLTRSESDTGNNHETPTPPQLNQPSVIVPAPSLPNLHTEREREQPTMTGWDMGAALWAQTAALTGGIPFFSMPSLLGANSGSLPMPMQAMQLPMFNGGQPILGINQTTPVTTERKEKSIVGFRPQIKLENRAFTSPLPAGGQPNLLKQQLRDLVLRRKSLVREETDAEITFSGDTGVTAAIEVDNDGGKTGLTYDSAMSKHQCLCGDNRNHVEHGGRVHSVWARLQERGLVDRCERVAARKAPLEQLRLVHSDTYVTFFGVSPTSCLKMDPSQLPVKSFVQLSCGGIGVDSDTYFNDSTTPLAARLSVGALTELCAQVAEGKLSNGFAAIRPPGHHAERDQAMGFCYFNNVAIAARWLQQKASWSGLRKIAIIDWDVHHGNGTQLVFESDPTVLYLSLHRHDNGNFFPGTGAVTDIGTGAGKGYSINVPFSGGPMGDPEYLAAWRVVVEPILDEFRPDFVLVSAGFDAAKGHAPALGGYNLTPALFGYMTSQLMRYAAGKVVLSLEGGYDLASISDASEECVKVLCGVESGGRLSSETRNTVPNQSAQETIQKVVAVHKNRWRLLTADHGLGMSEAEWETMRKRFASLSVNHQT